MTKAPEQSAKKKFVSFDDLNVPLGKRKQLFVKWLMSKGHSLRNAKLICYKRFYDEEHGDRGKRLLMKYLKKKAWGI